MGVLFRSALLSRAADAAGDVNTLMAVDAARLANLCVSFHELWSLPLQIAAAMWLLYVQVSAAASGLVYASMRVRGVSHVSSYVW
jgi:ATP-binding cassette subfamily C (CFTR/MRP) protein 10